MGGTSMTFGAYVGITWCGMVVATFVLLMWFASDEKGRAIIMYAVIIASALTTAAIGFSGMVR
jgi:hypothetical protein